MPGIARIWNADNLDRAWRWIRTNPDRGYKNYYRPLYASYESGATRLIPFLAARLRRGTYEPSAATKVLLPKSSGVLRPYTLLTVDDQLAYQAAVNVVADQLLPRVKGRYLSETFGHLYAGRSSSWFYRKWSDGYGAFNRAALRAYDAGFTFTASFDLTACYDSIDHAVLRHFLRDIDLDNEFCTLLTSWLSTWTATERRIVQNHGIPQGPLASGLLSEVVLRYFDDARGLTSRVRYFRYVDDIRLFARQEKDLRRMLVGLDRLSKDVGLFPQSSKIDIHEIEDIRKELKTISGPTDRALRHQNVDQQALHRRLNKLSPRFHVADPTRFKYELAHAVPNARLTSRLWKIYERAPMYYEPFCRYLSRYRRFPRNLAAKVLREIGKDNLYQSVTAAFVRAADGRMPTGHEGAAKRLFKRMWAPRVRQADLSMALAMALVQVRHLTGTQLQFVTLRGRAWWVSAHIFRALDEQYPGTSTGNRIANEAIRIGKPDVAIAAAWYLATTGLTLTGSKREISPSAKCVLREFGLLSRGVPGICGIHQSLERLCGRTPDIDWRRFFGPTYRRAEKQMIACRANSETSASAWVMALDVFNDWLLDGVYRKDPSIGTYTLGKIGSVLQSTRLRAKYPSLLAYVSEIHEKRLESNLAHPLVRRTGRPTKYIRFRYVRESKVLLRAAIREIAAIP